MEAYKKDFYSLICDRSNVEEFVENNNEYVVNRNEEGKIHSRYTDGKYEPAIIHKVNGWVHEFYLFDGKMIDSLHPFCISYKNGEILKILYYSIERIINQEPICVTKMVAYYNRYMFSHNGIFVCNNQILDECDVYHIEENFLEKGE